MWLTSSDEIMKRVKHCSMPFWGVSCLLACARLLKASNVSREHRRRQGDVARWGRNPLTSTTGNVVISNVGLKRLFETKCHLSLSTLTTACTYRLVLMVITIDAWLRQRVFESHCLLKLSTCSGFWVGLSGSHSTNPHSLIEQEINLLLRLFFSIIHCFFDFGTIPASFCLFSVFSKKQYNFHHKKCPHSALGFELKVSI